MRTGDLIKCENCGELITLDVYDITEGIARCTECSSDQPIEEEDKEWYVN